MDAGMRTAKNCNPTWLGFVLPKAAFFWMNCDHEFIFAWIGWIFLYLVGGFNLSGEKYTQKIKLDHLPREG